MKRYDVGDVVWTPAAEARQVEKVCPVCFGKRLVTLILGNDDRVELECKYCHRAYEAASGKIYELEYVETAERVTIREVRIELRDDGEHIYYIMMDNRMWASDEVFSLESEAQEAAKAMAEKLRKEEQTRAEYLKADQAKSYAWNAGYHMREAKRAEKSAARHRGQAKLCKAKDQERNGDDVA